MAWPEKGSNEELWMKAGVQTMAEEIKMAGLYIQTEGCCLSICNFKVESNMEKEKKKARPKETWKVQNTEGKGKGSSWNSIVSAPNGVR